MGIIMNSSKALILQHWASPPIIKRYLTCKCNGIIIKKCMRGDGEKRLNSQQG